MANQELKSFSQKLGIDVDYENEADTEVAELVSAVPPWFWQSARGKTLHFQQYDRPKARELAEYLWQGMDPDTFCSGESIFFLGEVSEPQPARLAYFAVLDSLALVSWRSASPALKNGWLAAIESWPTLKSELPESMSIEAFAHRLWAIGWRWLGNRKYEWMEHQLSTVSEAVRQFAGSRLLTAIPEIEPASPLWEAVRYGLRQDARSLYARLQKEFEEVEPLPNRDVKKRRDRQVRLREVFSRFSETCARCAEEGGSCCSRDIPHYYFAKADLSYLKGAGIPLPEFDPDLASSNSCIFIGPAGCRFPADLRPAVCLSHTCDAIYYELTQQEKSLLTRFELRRLMTIRDDRQ